MAKVLLTRPLQRIADDNKFSSILQKEGVDVIEILRGEQKQGIQVLAVGSQAPDGFHIEKLAYVQRIC